MVKFLTEEWVDALAEAAQTHRIDQPVPGGNALVVEQTVTGLADEGSFAYHVTFDDDRVRVRSGPAADATISFTQDLATAVGIAQGRDSAQAAFMSGRLRVGGDLTVLTTHGTAFAELADIFASVREQTVMPDTGPPDTDRSDPVETPTDASIAEGDA